MRGRRRPRGILQRPAQILEQAAARSHAHCRVEARHPRHHPRPARILERFFDERIAAKSDAVERVGDGQPGGLHKVVEGRNQFIGDRRCQGVEVVKMRIECPFGEPGLCDDFVDGDTLYCAQCKKGLRRGDERRVRARALLLTDLRASREVNLSHAGHIPLDPYSVKMTDPSHLGGNAVTLDDRNARTLPFSCPVFIPLRSSGIERVSHGEKPRIHTATCLRA